MTARKGRQRRSEVPLRERLGRAWRWPLYSRARFGGTLAGVVVVVLALPSPGAGADTSAQTATAAATPAVTWYPTPTADDWSTTAAATDPTTTSTPITTPTITTTDSVVPSSATSTTTSDTTPNRDGEGTSPGPTLSAPSTTRADNPATGTTLGTPGPVPPDLAPTAADYASPTAVAARYFQTWCYAPASSPANTNIAVAATWMTAAGWDDDKTRAVTDESWTATRNAGITAVCGPVTVDEIPAAPNTDTVHWLALSADRTYYDATGTPMSTETLNQTRQMVLEGGRWLVDVQAAAS